MSDRKMSTAIWQHTLQQHLALEETFGQGDQILRFFAKPAVFDWVLRVSWTCESQPLPLRFLGLILRRMRKNLRFLG